MVPQQLIDIQPEDVERLKEAIEERFGRKMLTPKDFEYLSAYIAEQQHETVSASTLKRLWGYIQTSSLPRRTTLDVLARLLDFADWDAFCLNDPDNAQQDRLASSQDISPGPSPSSKPRWFWFSVVSMVSVLIIGGILFFMRPAPAHTSGKDFVLRSGQNFTSTGDYLRLFGITDNSHPWSQSLPHHHGIIVWGPEYLHPEWHNEGNADSLMPTITEYWTPCGNNETSPHSVSTRNADNYLRAISFNELRITFMKGISRNKSADDSTYTFLGIYRLHRGLSDSTHLVWQRVAEDCDLANLDYLEQLRY